MSNEWEHEKRKQNVKLLNKVNAQDETQSK